MWKPRDVREGHRKSHNCLAIHLARPKVQSPALAMQRMTVSVHRNKANCVIKVFLVAEGCGSRNKYDQLKLMVGAPIMMEADEVGCEIKLGYSEPSKLSTQF